MKSPDLTKEENMNEYPVPYDMLNGRCLVPCPHKAQGVTGTVMLGSAYCREICKHHGDYGPGFILPGEPVKCLYDEYRGVQK